MTIPVYGQEQLRRLGQKSGQLGSLSADIQQVMIVAEHAGLAADPLEARGYASAVTASSTVELLAVPAGGVVIEELTLNAAAAVLLAVLPVPDPALAAQPFLDCGGVAAISRIAHGPGAAFPAQSQWTIGATVPVRIFVPPGKVFRAQASAGGLTYAIQWRELPTAQPT